MVELVETTLSYVHVYNKGEEYPVEVSAEANISTVNSTFHLLRGRVQLCLSEKILGETFSLQYSF